MTGSAASVPSGAEPRPRLLLLSGSIDPHGRRGMGGAEWHALRLALRLSERFCICFAVLEPPAADSLALLNDAGVSLRVLRKRGRADPRFWRALHRLLRSERIDAALGMLQGLNAHLLVAAMFAPRVAVVTSVFHLGLPYLPLQLAEGLLSRRAHRIVTPSPEAARLIRRDLGQPPGRVICVPLGCDESQFRPVAYAQRYAARERLGLPRDCFLLYSAARISRIKGHDVLAAALGQLGPAAFPRRPLWVNSGAVQDAQLAADCLALTQAAGVEARFIPPVTDVADWFAACDLAVMPSRSDSGPLAYIEAGAVGRPVLSASVGYAAALAPRLTRPLLFEAGSSAALAEALRAAAALPEAQLEAAGLELQALVSREYSLQACAAAYVRTLEEALAAHGRRAMR